MDGEEEEVEPPPGRREADGAQGGVAPGGEASTTNIASMNNKRILICLRSVYKWTRWL